MLKRLPVHLIALATLVGGCSVEPVFFDPCVSGGCDEEPMPDGALEMDESAGSASPEAGDDTTSGDAGTQTPSSDAGDPADGETFCAWDSCSRHGVCSDVPGGFVCDCDGAWGNDTCDEEIPITAMEGIVVGAAGTTAWVLDANLESLVSVDLATGNRVDLGGRDLFPNPRGLVLNEAQGVAYTADGFWGRLYAVDVVNGWVSTVSDRFQGDGPQLEGAVDVALNGAGDRAFVLIDSPYSLIEVDLASGDRRIVTGPENGDWAALTYLTSVSVEPEGTFALLTSNLPSAILRVDLETGERTVLSGAEVGAGPELYSPSSVRIDAGANTAWVMDYTEQGYRVVGVDLTTGDRRIVSDSSTGAGAELGQPSGLFIDAEAGVAWVSDRGTDAIHSVSLTTGDRERVVDSYAGTGPRFVSPRAIVAPASAATAWVAGYQGLLALDLATGDRSFVGGGATDLSSEVLKHPGEIAVDRNDPTHAWVTDEVLDSLVSIDLTTGEQRTVSSETVGTGPSLEEVTGIAVNAAATTAWLVYRNSSDVVAIDLTTGDRELVSAATRGQGPLMANPSGITVNEQGTLAWIVDFAPAALWEVDLTTGDRKLVSSEDLGNMWLGVPVGIVADDTPGRVWVLDEFRSIARVDLATGAVTTVSAWDRGPGVMFVEPSSMAVDAAGSTAWVVDARMDAVLEVDLQSGYRKVLSF